MRSIFFVALLSVLGFTSIASANRGWRPSGGRTQGPIYGAYPEGDNRGESWQDRSREAGPWLCASRNDLGYTFTGNDDDIYGATRAAQAACVEGSQGGSVGVCEPIGCRRQAAVQD